MGNTTNLWIDLGMNWISEEWVFFFLVEEKWVDCIYICMDRYESYQFEYRTRYIDFSKIEILPLSRDFEPDLVSNLVCFALQQEKRFFFFLGTSALGRCCWSTEGLGCSGDLMNLLLCGRCIFGRFGWIACDVDWLKGGCDRLFACEKNGSFGLVWTRWLRQKKVEFSAHLFLLGKISSHLTQP